MRLFISYCDNDGEGYDLATSARDLCKPLGIECWIWRDNCNSAKWQLTDIVENIESSDAVLVIITTGTDQSEPQKGEWSSASSFGIVKVSLKKEELDVPKELNAQYCPSFNEASFKDICQKVVDDLIQTFQLDKNSEKSLSAEEDKSGKKKIDESTIYELSHIANWLNSRQKDFEYTDIQKLHDSIWEGYLGSANVRHVASVGEARSEDYKHLRKISISKRLELKKFDNKSFWWGPFFRRLASEIAVAERKQLIKEINNNVSKIDKTCNEKTDDLAIVKAEIDRLVKVKKTPNVIIAPPSTLKSFVHYFQDKEGSITFQNELGSAGTLILDGGINIQIYLFGSGAIKDSLIVLQKASIAWKVVFDENTGYALSIGIGKGYYPDEVNYLIGTTARCNVVDTEAISMIGIDR